MNKDVNKGFCSSWHLIHVSKREKNGGWLHAVIFFAACDSFSVLVLAIQNDLPNSCNVEASKRYWLF